MHLTYSKCEQILRKFEQNAKFFPGIFLIRAQLGKKFELLYSEPIGGSGGGASVAPSLKFFWKFVEGVHVKLQNFNHIFKNVTISFCRFGQTIRRIKISTTPQCYQIFDTF